MAVKTGLYHADNGDAEAHLIREHEDGDTIAVLSDGDHGSGLARGWTVLDRIKRDDKTGTWTPKK